MRISIQEDMLPGQTPRETFEHARALGVDGVEVWGRGLAGRAEAIVDAMRETGVGVSVVNHGRQGRLLAPDPDERDIALTELRESITTAVDLGALGVVFVPHFGPTVLPDLSPWKSPLDLQAELLYMHLRTLSDFAYALGVKLFLAPVNQQETTFITRLEHAAAITRKLNHPDVKIAADLFHMGLEEDDVLTALHSQSDQVGYVHVAGQDRGLPGADSAQLADVVRALGSVGYDGWLSLACGQPGANSADSFAPGLAESVGVLRGLVG